MVQAVTLPMNRLQATAFQAPAPVKSHAVHAGLSHDTVMFGSTTPSVTDQAKAVLASVDQGVACDLTDKLKVTALPDGAVHDKVVDLLFADNTDRGRWDQDSLFSFAMVEGSGNQTESKRRINYAINKGLQSTDPGVYHAAAACFVKTSASSAFTGYEPAAVPGMVLRLLKDDTTRPGAQRQYKTDYNYRSDLQRQLWPEPKQTTDFKDDPVEIAKFPFNARYVVQSLMGPLYLDRSDRLSPQGPYPQQIDAQRQLEAAVLGSDNTNLKKLFLAQLPAKEFERVIATSADKAKADATFINQANAAVDQLLNPKGINIEPILLSAMPDEALFRSVVTRLFESTDPRAVSVQFMLGGMLRIQELPTLRAENANSELVKERIRFVGRLAEASPTGRVNQMGVLIREMSDGNTWLS